MVLLRVVGFSGGSIPPCFDDAEREKRDLLSLRAVSVERKWSTRCLRAVCSVMRKAPLLLILVLPATGVGDVLMREGGVNCGSTPHASCSLFE